MSRSQGPSSRRRARRTGCRLSSNSGVPRLWYCLLLLPRDSTQDHLREEEMLKGFRDFILRGNVVDLAVAVIIGAAFGAITASVTADVITPMISALVGAPDFSSLVIHMPVLHHVPPPPNPLPANYVRARRNSHWQAAECAHQLCAGGRGHLLCHRAADAVHGGPDQQAGGARSPSHQTMPRVPERHSAGRPAVRALRAAGSLKAG